MDPPQIGIMLSAPTTCGLWHRRIWTFRIPITITRAWLNVAS